ncbi:MAG: M20/M25/M40 family metallo-hydrolase [Pseudorhodoplanes sp.]|uniref:M20/M25/M40 family metallo-hydrolase n=1 Tax=Pseudorhodoplanes sp. TaxID=1934341 RepID=UPI003D0BA135
MNAVESFVDANFSRFIDEIVEACRIPSLSNDLSELRRCADFMARHLRQLGASVSVMPIGGNGDPPVIHATFSAPQSAPTLFIYGHFDVQPANESGWSSPPFDPQIKDGFIYGRGTCDNKAQLFAHLKAIETILAVFGELPLNIVLLLDPQEEIGTPLMAPFVTQHREMLRADFGLTADTEAAPGDRTTVKFGNRGNCYLTLRVRTAGRNVHSGAYGGLMPNAAWRLIDFLGTVRSRDGLVLIDGFYDDVAPPSEAELVAANALPFDAAVFQSQMQLDDKNVPSAETAWENIMFRPTCTVTGLGTGAGGYSTQTVIPSEAVAGLEMRLVNDQTPEDILEKARAHAARHGFDDVVIEEGMMYRPSRTPVDHPMAKVVCDAVKSQFGHEPLIVPVSGGSSPRYIWTEIAGIPFVDVSYAQNNASSHGPNECMSLSRLRQGILTTVQIIQGLAQLRTGPHTPRAS